MGQLGTGDHLQRGRDFPPKPERLETRHHVRIGHSGAGHEAHGFRCVCVGLVGLIEHLCCLSRTVIFVLRLLFIQPG